MEYYPEKKEIKLNRVPSELDKFVIDFCNLLDSYVLVSGYVSIIFGRSRATEDVDLLIPKMNFDSFKNLWKKIHSSGFECLNTSIPEDAFEMVKEHNIRFSRIGKPLPNMEFKLIEDEIQEYSFKNKLKVLFNKQTLYISSLEMQIAYKLMLGRSGNKKDIEDAKHIYELFKEKLNNPELLKLIEDLDVKKEFKLIK